MPCLAGVVEMPADIWREGGGRGVVGDGRIDGKKRLNGDGRAGAWVLGEDGGAVRGWTPANAATRLAGRAAAATAVVLTSGGRYG